MDCVITDCLKYTSNPAFTVVKLKLHLFDCNNQSIITVSQE
jgi:hypothetical protein